MGKINEKGTKDYDLNTFMTKKFMLPFSMSQSINIFDETTAQTVQQSNIQGNSDRRILYLKFKTELTYTMKLTAIYLQHRSLNIDSERRVFKVTKTYNSSKTIEFPTLYNTFFCRTTTSINNVTRIATKQLAAQLLKNVQRRKIYHI